MSSGSSRKLPRDRIGHGTGSREVAKLGASAPRVDNRIDKKFIYRMLNNRAYIGEAVHKGESYPGEHDAIIDRDVMGQESTRS